MRFTQTLYKYTMNRFINDQWRAHSKRKIVKRQSEEVLTKLGYEVIPATEFIKPLFKKEKIEVVGPYELPVPLDENHPDWKETPCYIYKDTDVLLEGVRQAQNLTNTIVKEEIPASINEIENQLSLSHELHRTAEERVILSSLFEATQKRLPKRHDPSRPAWTFPRDYGIIHSKKIELICNNLMNLCERYYNAEDHSVLSNATFSLPLNFFDKMIKFELTSELLLTARHPLRNLISPEETTNLNLPELGPVHCTVSLTPYNFYHFQDSFPVKMDSKWPYIHTAVLHFDPTKVKNLFDVDVSEDQIRSRSLLKGFCFAWAQARSQYGADIVDLPEPITVQIVQTNGHFFHFSAYQLNTLSLNDSSTIKNVFWNPPLMNLYESCSYVVGRPQLLLYNPGVLKRLVAFCSNK